MQFMSGSFKDIPEYKLLLVQNGAEVFEETIVEENFKCAMTQTVKKLRAVNTIKDSCLLLQLSKELSLSKNGFSFIQKNETPNYLVPM